MSSPQTHINMHTNIDAVLDQIITHCGPHIIAATPLGIGKPNRLLNALYARVKGQPEKLSLRLYSALTLTVPQGKSALERQFLQPFILRQFGADYPDLDYWRDLSAGCLPGNIRIHEFYFASGSQLNNPVAQADYISQNYTHVARDLAAAGVTVLLQQIAKRGDRYSLGSNPDVGLDLKERLAAQGKKLLFVGVVNSAMPFLGGDAEIDGHCVDLILDEQLASDKSNQRLFALPREAVSSAEHALGLRASTLVKDGGTLQIGIGALSDAIVNALLLRQHKNERYRAALKTLHSTENIANDKLVQDIGGLMPFVQGLYGATEMVMDGFMHLRRAGILKREVFEDEKLHTLLNAGRLTQPLANDTLSILLQEEILPLRLDATVDGALWQWLQAHGFIAADTQLSEGHIHFANGRVIGADLNDANNFAVLAAHISGRRLRGGHYLEGAFLLGSSALYQWLHSIGEDLEGDDWRGLAMRKVSGINELYGGNENLERLQRRDARFFNTCMMQTLLGAAVSDSLENNQVVSGVGGQYNFVAMAHALHDGRSILLLRSTRSAHGRTQSNIVWNYGHTTIPRHLRDIVITEYGIADLRGQSDSEVIKRLLAISDARFQDDLIARAKAEGKLGKNFVKPAHWRDNTPEHIEHALKEFQNTGEFASYPFGSDFDATELRLIGALKKLKAATTTKSGTVLTLLRSLLPAEDASDTDACLARMSLQSPRTMAGKIQARLLRRMLRSE